MTKSKWTPDGRALSGRDRALLYSRGFGDGAKCVAQKEPEYPDYMHGYEDGTRARRVSCDRYRRDHGLPEETILRAQSAPPPAPPPAEPDSVDLELYVLSNAALSILTEAGGRLGSIRAGGGQGPNGPELRPRLWKALDAFQAKRIATPSPPAKTEDD